MTLSFQQIEVLVAQWTFEQKARLVNFLQKDLGQNYPSIEKTPTHLLNFVGVRLDNSRARSHLIRLIFDN